MPSICIAHTPRKKTDDTWKFLKTKQTLNGKKKKKKEKENAQSIQVSCWCITLKTKSFSRNNNTYYIGSQGRSWSRAEYRVQSSQLCGSSSSSMEEIVSANKETRSSSSSKFIIEEWNGSSSSKLFKTATITTSPYLSIQRSPLYIYTFTSLLLLLYSSFWIESCLMRRSGSRFNHVWRRVLQAFVPEASPSPSPLSFLLILLWQKKQNKITIQFI